jgi:hypothetical protein
MQQLDVKDCTFQLIPNKGRQLEFQVKPVTTVSASPQSTYNYGVHTYTKSVLTVASTH